MKSRDHVIISLGISALIYHIYASVPAFISSFAGGVFIDIDHLLDYYINKGINFRINGFLNWCYNREAKKLTLIFHSIELVFAFWIIIYIFNLNIFWIALAAGISQHMILDIIYNGRHMKVISYFFAFRVSKHFKNEYFLREQRPI